MNFNFDNILSKSLPKGIVQPHRAQVYVGFMCHQKCGFCYYIGKCNEEMFSLEDVIKQVDFQLEYGIVDFEITGGEPSEFKQIRELCQYIKQKSPKSKIAVITNGGLWCRDVWDVIDEVLISYHLSRNDKDFDHRMFPLGSTYEKVAKTVEVAKKNGVLVRTNTVLGTFNIDSLSMIVDDLVGFEPNIVNFLPLNTFEQSSTMSQYIDYGKLRPKLKEAISILEHKLPSSLVFARYMPFCQMEGFQKNIVGNLQHIYDWFDWNREIDGTFFLKYVLTGRGDELLKKFGRYGSTSLSKVIDLQNSLYEKSSKCLKCKYMLICDGVEKTKDGSLLKYISPMPGKIVKNFMEYNNCSTQKFYQEHYGKF